MLVHRQTSNAYRTHGGTGGKSFASVIFCGSATRLLLGVRGYCYFSDNNTFSSLNGTLSFCLSERHRMFLQKPFPDKKDRGFSPL